jgi:hypothetical protein
MIFLSHNHKDKTIVEQLAVRLKDFFGQDSLFYDSWSIQTGDGIIDKMNKGLSECKFFIFFVSKNSLHSKLVELEWQNAVLKATKGETKFIPVKLDDCLMPVVLSQTLWINLFNEGLEVTLRQLTDVITGKNTYRQQNSFHNLEVEVKNESYKVIIQCKALHYMEPISHYLFLVNNKKEDLQFKCLSQGMFTGGFNEGVKLNNGQIVNGQSMAVGEATVPGFPFIVEIIKKKEQDIKLIGIMHEKTRGQWSMIPMKEETETS